MRRTPTSPMMRPPVLGVALALAVAGGCANHVEIDSNSGAASGGGAAGAGGGVAWPCGEPAVLAKGLYGAEVAVDADYVYWPAYGGVTRFDKVSGERVVLAPVAQRATSIAIGGGRVYWTEGSVSDGNDLTQIVQYGSLRAVDVAGGDSALLADGLPSPGSVAVGTESVFWIDRGSFPADSAPDGAIFRIGKGGGAVTVIADGQVAPQSVRVDDSGIYAATNVPPETPGADGRLLKWTKDATEMEVLVMGRLPRALALDGADLYWSDDAYGTSLNVMPKGGGTSVSLTGEPATEWGITQIAVGADEVYWSDGYSGAIRAMPKSGGEIRVIASGQDQPDGIAVDDTCVYWVNVGSDTLMAARR